MSDLPALLTKLRELWAERAPTAYRVRRGAVNWSAFDFKQHPRGVAIILEESPLLPQPGNNRATIGFEVFAAMHTGEAENLDDGVLEELRDDARAVIGGIAEWVVDGRPQCDVDLNSAVVDEAYDLRRGVQGILVSFDVLF